MSDDDVIVQVGSDMPGWNNNQYAIRVSHEEARHYGLIESTPEELAEDERRTHEWMLERNRQTLIREAAWAALRGLTDSGVRAVLDLHAMVDAPHEYSVPTCAHCYDGGYMGDHQDWPCDTVRAIATTYGIEMP